MIVFYNLLQEMEGIFLWTSLWEPGVGAGWGQGRGWGGGGGRGKGRLVSRGKSHENIGLSPRLIPAGVFNSQASPTQPQAIHQNQHLSIPTNNWLQWLLPQVTWTLLWLSVFTCLSTFGTSHLPGDVSSLGLIKVIALLLPQCLSCFKAWNDNF